MIYSKGLALVALVVLLYGCTNANLETPTPDTQPVIETPLVSQTTEDKSPNETSDEEEGIPVDMLNENMGLSVTDVATELALSRVSSGVELKVTARNFGPANAFNVRTTVRLVDATFVSSGAGCLVKTPTEMECFVTTTEGFGSDIDVSAAVGPVVARVVPDSGVSVVSAKAVSHWGFEDFVNDPDPLVKDPVPANNTATATLRVV
jgi:hypothetical protein